jgi:alpha-L-fucosidase
LYKQFNPTEFNADEWASIAKDAGMKYLVITTKHHDGFCLWPSKYTDYHIGNSPFKRDVLKELSTACRKHGIDFGTYYSVCDWHHPDYPKGSPGGKTDKPDPNLDRYMQYLQNQTAELVTNYGPLSTMWFDVPREVHEPRGLPATQALRKLQPNIVINNRGYMEPSGDYDTPEQEVGGFDRDRPWETCMTICRQWAWKPKDKLKSKQQCIQTLLHTVGGDGNLLLNVGPMPDGRIEPRQVERLKEMGAWLKKYGDGVYGTRGGPFKPGKWGASTCKGEKIYLYVMNWPDKGPLKLPAIGQKITDSKTLSGGIATVKQSKDSIAIDLSVSERDEIATIIELTLDGKAFQVDPVDVAHGSLIGEERKKR